MRTPPRRIRQTEEPKTQQTRERTTHRRQADTGGSTPPRRRGKQAAGSSTAIEQADTHTESRTKKQRTEQSKESEE